MSIISTSIAQPLLIEIADLKKIRKGYTKGSVPWLYNCTLKNLSAFTGFPALINSAELRKVSVKQYKKDPMEQSWVSSSGSLTLVIPLTLNGTYHLQLSQYNSMRLVYGNAYVFSGNKDYKLNISKAGIKDFYFLVLDCDES